MHQDRRLGILDESISRKANLFGAWCGFVYLCALPIGWFVVAGFFPLLAPSENAAQIGAFFRTNTVNLRLGMVILMWSAALMIPFTAAIADLVEGIEGRSGPLTKNFLLAGYANAMVSFLPPLLWIANTFRSSERSDDLIYMLNDVAYFEFVGGLSIITPMFVVIAVVAFLDKSPRPVFPRWSGYVSIMTFLLFLPDQACFFFKTGPFGWNGLLAFWMPLSVFGIWFLMMAYLVRRSTKRVPIRQKN